MFFVLRQVPTGSPVAVLTPDRQGAFLLAFDDQEAAAAYIAEHEWLRSMRLVTQGIYPDDLVRMARAASVNGKPGTDVCLCIQGDWYEVDLDELPGFLEAAAAAA